MSSKIATCFRTPGAPASILVFRGGTTSSSTQKGTTSTFEDVVLAFTEDCTRFRELFGDHRLRFLEMLMFPSHFFVPQMLLLLSSELVLRLQIAEKQLVGVFVVQRRDFPRSFILRKEEGSGFFHLRRFTICIGGRIGR